MRDPDQIEAGRLRQLVQLQQASFTPGANGELAPAWTTIVTLNAEVLVLGGTKEEMANESVAVAVGTVQHRYYAALSPTNMRYLWGDLALEIVSVVSGPRQIGQMATFKQTAI